MDFGGFDARKRRLSQLIVVKKIILKKVVEGFQKNYFPLGGILKFTNKRRFWTMKIAYEKILD